MEVKRAVDEMSRIKATLARYRREQEDAYKRQDKKATQEYNDVIFDLVGRYKEAEQRVEIARRKADDVKRAEAERTERDTRSIRLIEMKSEKLRAEVKRADELWASVQRIMRGFACVFLGGEEPRSPSANDSQAFWGDFGRIFRSFAGGRPRGTATLKSFVKQAKELRDQIFKWDKTFDQLVDNIDHYCNTAALNTDEMGPAAQTRAKAFKAARKREIKKVQGMTGTLKRVDKQLEQSIKVFRATEEAFNSFLTAT